MNVKFGDSVTVHNSYYFSSTSDHGMLGPQLDFNTTCTVIALIASTTLALYLICAKYTLKRGITWLCSLLLLSFTRDALSYCLISFHSGFAWMYILAAAHEGDVSAVEP